MYEPTVIVLYVNDLGITSQFYQQLLGIEPEQASPTFHSFTLSNGMRLALKAKYSVVPPIEEKNGYGELAFTVDSQDKVDRLFSEWKSNGISMLFSPTLLSFGYTFVALDPDGYRLRVAFLGQS